MRRRLLLVEDEDSIRDIARISLEQVGDWKVTPARSGREAIELASRGDPPDAVLLDVMMPGLDGPSTLAALQAGPLGGDVPFVFLTAKLQAADRKRLAEIGASGVIAKPFDPMTLAAQLDRILATAPGGEAGGEGPRIHADFADIWLRRRDVAEARAETVAAALAQQAGGRLRPDRLEEAISAAHMLSGSLGTFGLHRGSELARCLERGLAAGEPPSRLQPLSVELVELVAAAAVESRLASSSSTWREPGEAGSAAHRSAQP